MFITNANFKLSKTIDSVIFETVEQKNETSNLIPVFAEHFCRRIVIGCFERRMYESNAFRSQRSDNKWLTEMRADVNGYCEMEGRNHLWQIPFEIDDKYVRKIVDAVNPNAILKLPHLSLNNELRLELGECERYEMSATQAKYSTDISMRVHDRLFGRVVVPTCRNL